MANITVLIGPTAVGKTQCIKSLAHHFCAVIYADTACMYKELNIGVAKPPPEDSILLPHHLVNNLELDEYFDAGQFFQQTERLCADLAQKNKPILVSGGSLFYIHNFLFGPSKVPSSDKNIRLYWKNRWETLNKNSQKLHTLLQTVDPATAKKLNPNDSYRVMRALEVHSQTQIPLSQFIRPTTLRTQHNWLIIELQRSRDDIYQRIENRLNTMWDQGLLNEIDHLITSKKVTVNTPAMRAIGYKEFLENPEKKNDTDIIKKCIKTNTKHYAKRQITFLKKLPINQQIHGDNYQKLNEAINNWKKTLVR